MSTDQTAAEAQVAVRNIGGIDETSVEFTPGVTILAGENATNRTSLLRAIMAVLGSDDVSMKGNTDDASVEMIIDGESYTRKFTRRDGGFVSEGEPYLEDSTLAELFAFLLESNEARRAVLTDADLRELIMRPVDTNEIQAEIDRLLARQTEIDEELDELDRLKNKLPTLEEKRVGLEEEIESAKSKLADEESKLKAKNANIEETKAEKAELKDRLAELRSKRSELEDIRYELETERESLKSTRARRREVESELEEHPEESGDELEKLNVQIDRLRGQKRTVESEVNELQSVIRFNRDMIDGDEGLGSLEASVDDDAEVADELVSDDIITCWTCGSEVSREQIETTVSRLRELSRDKLDEMRDIEDQLEECTDERQTYKQKQKRREKLQCRRSNLEEELERIESTIERLTDRRGELRRGIETLEAEIAELEDESYEEILSIHKKANQLEYELGGLEGDLDDIEAEIGDIENRLDDESELRERREGLTAEIVNLRTRIDRIEREAVEGFNEHMDSVLEILGYGNLERIWIERLERELREGRRKVTKSVFELHIVRQTDGGVTYEDTIDHLSESEREVTGLVFALAGYLAHEVYETVPFMLLDSLEAIDANRIAALIEYVEGFSEYLVVALLSEDAAALSETYRRISDI